MHTKNLLLSACHSHQTSSNAAIKVTDLCSHIILLILPLTQTIWWVSADNTLPSYYWRSSNYQFLFLFLLKMGLLCSIEETFRWTMLQLPLHSTSVRRKLKISAFLIQFCPHSICSPYTLLCNISSALQVLYFFLCRNTKL